VKDSERLKIYAFSMFNVLIVRAKPEDEEIAFSGACPVGSVFISFGYC